MNSITRLLLESSSAVDFAGHYLKYVSEILRSLDAEAVAQIADELEKARAGRHKIFVAGNGGSAATASHMVNDLVFGTRSTFRVASLTDGTSLFTAIANDISYEQVFVWQLEQAFEPSDRLIVITASGNSPNIVAAAKWMRERGGRVIGLLGFDGGAVKQFCDVYLLVNTPNGEYGPVEDVHLIVNHILSAWFRHQTGEA